jgi:hypothetical protein
VPYSESNPSPRTLHVRISTRSPRIHQMVVRRKVEYLSLVFLEIMGMLDHSLETPDVLTLIFDPVKAKTMLLKI